MLLRQRSSGCNKFHLKEADVAPAKSKTQSQKSHIPGVSPKNASSASSTGHGKKLTAQQAMQQGIKPHLGGSAGGIKKAAASTTVATNVGTSEGTLPALTLLRDRTESAKAVLDLVAEIKPLKAAADPENCEAARNVVAIKFRELLNEFAGIPRPDRVEDCFRVLGL